MSSRRNPLIVGAGPAGLTAALKLAERGAAARVYEATGTVGGLARTPTSGQWRVDPGGHRFFTKDEEVLDLWNTLLPADQWISVPRSSAMLVHGQYVQYPLVGRDLLTQMGFREGLHGMGSLLWSRIRRRGRRPGHTASFREWGTHEFGRYWYTMFFDSYVRKTWLADPGAIASDWASQRIKPIAWHLLGGRGPESHDTFRYPRHGPGQLWEAAAAASVEAGAVISLHSPVVTIRPAGDEWEIELQNGETACGDAVFSSMPLRQLVDVLEPQPPHDIRAAAAELKHRALITVAVALHKRYEIPFNWVYTPGREFRVGRVQNYCRWSNTLAPHGFEGTYLGLEYFTLPEDDLWIMIDESLGTIVEQDLRALGFDESAIDHVAVVRSLSAYPIYDSARDASVAAIRDYLHRTHPTLHPIGRNGMHRYDNQDHAMLSAMRSVARYFGEDADPWQVNTERHYHESNVLNR
jgi:UDP-galactopyranose mutase